MNDLLFIDFETYYDTKSNYCLQNRTRPKGLSICEYVRDPRFKVHGLGIAWDNGMSYAPKWIGQNDIEAFLKGTNWSTTTVVGHNLKFDGFILAEKYRIKPVEWRDTKGMSRAVLGKTVPNHSLSTLATHFGLVSKGVLATDGIRDLTAEQEAQLADYCLHDVELCAQIYSLLTKDFPDSQYASLDQTVRMFVEPKLVLDVGLLQKTAEEEKRRKETIFSDLQIDKKEFASNVKFPKLLEKEGFEVPIKQSPRTGKTIAAIALGDPAFLDMAEQGCDRLKTLCEARIAAKSTLLETRSEKLASIGRTGLWPFDVEFSGANQTHRFSGGNGAGGNPQNFKRDSALRAAVKAPNGCKLIVGDFSNIELRLVAYLSNDPGLIEGIEKGIDLYCDFASVFYGRKITKEDENARRFGKSAILGLGYNMGAKKFQKTVRLQTGQDITEQEAERAVELYRRRYLKVPQLWKYLDSYIQKLTENESGKIAGLPINYEKEALVLPSGLKMRYSNLRKEGREWAYTVYGKEKEPRNVNLYGGKVLENICQGLAGELCKEVAIQFNNVTGLVHDEIHVLTKNYEANMVANRLKKAMETSPRWLAQMKLKAEIGIGESWLGAK